jgi:hypothetical protein
MEIRARPSKSIDCVFAGEQLANEHGLNPLDAACLARVKPALCAGSRPQQTSYPRRRLLRGRARTPPALIQLELLDDIREGGPQLSEARRA